MSTLAVSATAMEGRQVVLQPWALSRAAWKDLATPANGATLYHDERWIALLEQTYGFEVTVAGIHEGRELAAGCVLARTKNPLNPRLVALPFSDNCPPLATEPALIPLLADHLIAQVPPRGGYEIRGFALPAPWQTVDCFGEWTINLTRPVAELSRRSATHFRRQVRRALKSGLTVRCSSSLEDLHHFYRLMMETRHRKGLPVQPMRFFKYAHELFAPAGDIEIWSVREGATVVAVALILRAFDCLHYKWSARHDHGPSGAAHLLLWNVIERHAGVTGSLNLGRTDLRNAGLVRFKKDVGAEAAALPSSFYPTAPNQISAEMLSGPMAVLSQVWRHLPPIAARALSSAIYRYMA
ncbi:MAG: GNAT family N-acetyltransferase [Candidatus Binataceae bacterium]